MTIANLTDPREAAFVAALFDLGGPQHGTEAAMRAGYAATPEKAARAAAFLLGSARISRCILVEIKARFDVAAGAAFSTLLSICVSGRSEQARISAAQEILNRPLGPIPSRSVTLTAQRSVEDLLARLDRTGKRFARFRDCSGASHDAGKRDCGLGKFVASGASAKVWGPANHWPPSPTGDTFDKKAKQGK